MVSSIGKPSSPRLPTVTTPAESKTQAAPPRDAVKKGWAAESAGAVSNADTAATATKTAGDFYAAFAKRDADGMAKLYDQAVTFHDPLFGHLNGAHQVMEMWKTIMPAANPATFKLEPTVHPNPVQKPDGSWEVKVHWDAHYDLGNRHVDNQSDTTLLIKHGKIIGQRDEWDLSRWTKQALPFGGGTKTGNTIASFAAHTFVEVKDMLDRGHWH